MNLESSISAAPMRVSVIQRELYQSTVYYASDTEYLKLWKTLGPRNGHPVREKIFVVPEHRLIVVSLQVQELQGNDLFQQGKARISPLRQLEIHQGIRYGLIRMRGASATRAHSCLSSGFGRWQEKYNIFLHRSEPSRNRNGEAANRVISVGGLKVLLLGDDEWESLAHKDNIVGSNFKVKLNSDKIECVTTQGNLRGLIDYLRENYELCNSLDMALAIQALHEYELQINFEESQKLINDLDTDDELRLARSEEYSRMRLARKFTLLAKEVETSIGGSVSLGQAWAELLNELGLDVRQEQSISTLIDSMSERLRLLFDLVPEIAQKDHLIVEAVQNWLKKQSVLPLSLDLRMRVAERQQILAPEDRAQQACRNQLGRKAPIEDVRQQRMLINHQCARVYPGSFRGFYVEELECNSLFRIPPGTQFDFDTRQPKWLDQAKYLQVRWEFQYDIDIEQLGAINALLLIRHHTRTQAKLTEYPSYRYSLQSVKLRDDKVHSEVLDFSLEALNIPICEQVLSPPDKPTIVIKNMAGTKAPLFYHPYILGERGIPIEDLGLHVSTCYRYAFARTVHDPKPKFVNLKNQPLSTSLCSSRHLEMDYKVRKERAGQIIEYLGDVSHFVYVPSSMNLVLEPLDFEVKTK
jgi:hypothetical protein